MIKKYLNKILISAFPIIFSLPIPLKYSAIGLILFCIICLFNSNESFNYNLSNNKFSRSVLICFVFYFFIDVLVAFLFGRKIEIYEVKLPFLILPIVFLISSNFIYLNKVVIAKAFLFGQVLYIAYATCYMAYFYSNQTYESFAFDGYLRYSLYHHLPGAIHHTYLGLNLFLAIVFLVELNLVKNKILKYMLLALLLEYSLFLSSKSIIFVLVIYLMVRYLITNKKILLIGASLIVISLSFFDFSWFIGKMKSSIDQRGEIWHCATKLISENPIGGIGRAKIKEMINSCNNEIGYMDAHNLWLQELLSNGFFGFLLLVILFVTLIKISIKNKVLLYFILGILSAGIIEHLFNLQRGVMFFTFFCLLLLENSSQVSIKKNYS